MNFTGTAKDLDDTDLVAVGQGLGEFIEKLGCATKRMGLEKYPQPPVGEELPKCLQGHGDLDRVVAVVIVEERTPQSTKILKASLGTSEGRQSPRCYIGRYPERLAHRVHRCCIAGIVPTS